MNPFDPVKYAEFMEKLGALVPSGEDPAAVGAWTLALASRLVSSIGATLGARGLMTPEEVHRGVGSGAGSLPLEVIGYTSAELFERGKAKQP